MTQWTLSGPKASAAMAAASALSMPPAGVGPVKAMIRTLHVGDLKDYLDYLCTEPHHSLRLQLERFAKDHGVEIG